MEQRTGCAATLSIVAALGSFIASCAGNPGLGILLALVSMPVGLVGLVMSASPRVSGGLLSIAAMVLGAIGLVFSLVAATGALVFR
jgi:hypothetical protein